MIQEFIWLLVLFGLFWIVGAIGHELFHGLACWLQDCKFKISIWWNKIWKIKIPSMICTPQDTLINKNLFYYLGGIGLGSTFIIISLVFYFIYVPVFITLFLVGIAHLIYGIYEGLFIRKMQLDLYMWVHYWVYLASVFIGMLLINQSIIHYIW